MDHVNSAADVCKCFHNAFLVRTIHVSAMYFIFPNNLQSISTKKYHDFTCAMAT